MSITPFSFVEAASSTKEDIIRDGDATEKDYNAFIVNKSFSFFPDSIFDLQEMNRYSNLDGLMQFDYYRASLRKRKRHSQWFKKIDTGNLEVVSETFNFSLNKARDAFRALTDKQLDAIKSHLKHGG